MQGEAPGIHPTGRGRPREAAPSGSVSAPMPDIEQGFRADVLRTVFEGLVVRFRALVGQRQNGEGFI